MTGNIGVVRLSLRKLALATTVATVLLIAIGGLVRATGSGLGCGDDWPDCNGQLLPVLDARPVIIEWTHRAVAMVVGLMTALLVVVAFRNHREDRSLRRLTAGAFALVVLQALLGRVVVKEHLEVLLVVGHLATALLFLGVLITTFVAAGPRESGTTNPSAARGVLVAAGAIFVLLLVGSYTSDFGYVPGWPLQQGRLIPNLQSETQAIHFLHRTLAVAVGVVVAAVASSATRSKAESPGAAKLARSAAGLFAVEVLIGAVNVWTALNPIVVALHLTTGALVWACMVGMWAVATVPSWAPYQGRERDAALAPAGAAD